MDTQWVWKIYLERRRGITLWTDRDCTEMQRFEKEEAKNILQISWCRTYKANCCSSTFYKKKKGPTYLWRATFKENSRSENIPINTKIGDHDPSFVFKDFDYFFLYGVINSFSSPWKVLHVFFAIFALLLRSSVGALHCICLLLNFILNYQMRKRNRNLLLLWSQIWNLSRPSRPAVV